MVRKANLIRGPTSDAIKNNPLVPHWSQGVIALHALECSRGKLTGVGGSRIGTITARIIVSACITCCATIIGTASIIFIHAVYAVTVLIDVVPFGIIGTGIDVGIIIIAIIPSSAISVTISIILFVAGGSPITGHEGQRKSAAAGQNRRASQQVLQKWIGLSKGKGGTMWTPGMGAGGG